MKMKFANNAVAALASVITTGATSFSVSTSFGALFPVLSTGEYFYVRLGSDSSSEVVKVTGRSNDVFTCDATVNGWGAGTNVVLTSSAELLSEFAQADGGGQVLKDHVFRDYAETVVLPTSASAVLTLDMSGGNIFEVEMTEAVTTLTISNPPISGLAGSITLILTQDATGGWAFTWPASVKWAGGVAPTLTTDADAIDILTLITTDGGVTWFGMLAGAAFAVPA